MKEILRLIIRRRETPFPPDYFPGDPENGRASAPERVRRELDDRNRKRRAEWRSKYLTGDAVNERYDHLRRYGRA